MVRELVVVRADQAATCLRPRGERFNISPTQSQTVGLVYVDSRLCPALIVKRFKSLMKHGHTGWLRDSQAWGGLQVVRLSSGSL
eukprot:g23908.t1